MAAANFAPLTLLTHLFAVCTDNIILVSGDRAEENGILDVQIRSTHYRNDIFTIRITCKMLKLISKLPF